MNLETSKERKEKLENRKKEVLALKKQRNLDKIKEKALMCETFQENVIKIPKMTKFTKIC